MKKSLKNYLNDRDKKKYNKAKELLSKINEYRETLKEMKIVRSNKLISPDYCEWISGSIIGATGYVWSYQKHQDKKRAMITGICLAFAANFSQNS